MTKREEYLQKMHAAVDRMQVKAGLAKLELRDVRDELMKKYDTARNRLRELGEASGDRWDALRDAFESAWASFRERYEKVMDEHREGERGG